VHTSTKMFALCALLLGGSSILATSEVRLAGDHQGYEPEQPIAYSHRLHAGELGIDCLYCHYGAERGRHAGIPSASVCMNCHTTVTDAFDSVLTERERAKAAEEEPRRSVSPELRKLYDFMGLGEDLEPAQEPIPIPWQRIHQLPDFAFFDHSVHVAQGVACATCHGPVQGMERVRQQESLSMGWCIDCHRSNEASPTALLPDPEAHPHVSTDCVSCHL
jgi:Cytochrome c7 and related cytochrome c